MLSANDLLEKERYKKNISGRKLVKGVCSPQLLIKAVQSNTNIELLTFKILLERVGRSPEHLEFILSKKEYENILTRDKIEEFIYLKDYSSAQNLLKIYINDNPNNLSALKMYYHRINSWIYSEKGDYLRAKESILNAIYTTLPDITFNN